jgi:hypothetical protein
MVLTLDLTPWTYGRASSGSRPPISCYGASSSATPHCGSDLVCSPRSVLRNWGGMAPSGRQLPPLAPCQARLSIRAIPHNAHG